MILNSIVITTDNKPQSTSATDALYAPLLSMMVLTVYAGQKTEQEIRRLKRKTTLFFIQHKVKNFIARLLPSKKIRSSR
jgi:hypothetical protein